MSESSSLTSIVRKKTWKAEDKAPTFSAMSESLSPPASTQAVHRLKAEDDETPLALFHKKFWGKSMKDEESEWRRSQIRIVDQDQDKITDMDDDIVPGCYVLDISIPGIRVSHLWIRADYIRVFDYFQTHYDKYDRPTEDVPSGVLTGQPGIGKSYWIYYAARRCAAEMKPFIWFFQAAYYLFVDDGVHLLPNDWKHSDFLCTIWTLVDSDQCEKGVPEKLIPHSSSLFVIYATCPTPDRWSRMAKTTRRVVVIMNPWGRKEIKRAANLKPFENFTEGHIDEIFDLLGPVPRLCINFSSHQLKEYKDALNMVVSSITVDEIEKLINDTFALSMGEVSHKIFLLSRMKRDDIHSQAAVAPISLSIQSKLAARFRNLDRDEQIRLYKHFESVPESKKVAGIFYEAIVQSCLQNGRILELLPMVPVKETKRRSSEDGAAPVVVL